MDNIYISLYRSNVYKKDDPYALNAHCIDLKLENIEKIAIK